MSRIYFCDFLLFEDVGISSAIRQACVDGKFRFESDEAGSLQAFVTILKSSLVLDTMQLKVAVSKAVLV
jgi:hypothetical protein